MGPFFTETLWSGQSVQISVSTLDIISADGILKYFSYFSQNTGFDISCKLSSMETNCIKCKSCFLGRKENVINLSLAQKVIKIKKAFHSVKDHMHQG